KFEPWSLIRLHPTCGARPSYDEPASNVEISSGTLTVKKKNYTPADYGKNNHIWVTAFVNYKYVYSRLFGRQHPDVPNAQNRFMAFILDKSATYSWTECLKYAMRHHINVKLDTIHNAAAWLDHPRVKIDSAFTYLTHINRPQISSEKRQRSDTVT
ncbi:hypothetical protein E4U49_008213, partial [Claviceps purpurea]